MERSHRPSGKRQQYLTRARAMFKSEYRPLDAELCKTSANAVAQTRSRENPIPEPTVSFFPCVFCLSWYCWLLWGSAHRAAQENTLSCRGSAQAGTEIGPAEACLSVCLSERGEQQYLLLLWGFHWRWGGVKEKRREKGSFLPWLTSSGLAVRQQVKSWCCLHGKTAHVQTWLFPGN